MINFLSNLRLEEFYSYTEKKFNKKGQGKQNKTKERNFTRDWLYSGGGGGGGRWGEVGGGGGRWGEVGRGGVGWYNVHRGCMISNKISDCKGILIARKCVINLAFFLVVS